MIIIKAENKTCDAKRLFYNTNKLNSYILCDDYEQFSKSKVQRNNTKQEQSKNGTLKKLEVGSGVIMED